VFFFKIENLVVANISFSVMSKRPFPFLQHDWRREEADEQQQKLRTAGAALFRSILELFALNKISAQDTCILFWHSHLAGAVGAEFETHMLAPGKQSGKYQAHLDTVLPSPGPLYYADVPCSPKGKGDVLQGLTQRRKVSTPISPLWLRLQAELQTQPDMLDELRPEAEPFKNHNSVMSTPSYMDHKVVQDAMRRNAVSGLIQPLPLPLALYIDGVRFTAPLAGRTESVLGIWIINLLTQKRHYFASLRTLDACRCGCKGNCSIYVLMFVLRWQLRWLAKGKAPATRHDRTSFAALDPLCKTPGESLPFNCALLQVKGDWAEHCKTLGLSSWSSYACPCVFCCATKDDIHCSYADISLLHLPWLDRGAASYEMSCRERELCIDVVNENIRKSILKDGVLVCGKKGMALHADLPLLGLRTGDKLKPSDDLLDTSDFVNMPLPFVAVFWRPNIVDGVSFDPVHDRSPIFDEEIGTSPDETLAIDTLHTLYYGPANRWSSAVLWRLVLGGKWSSRGQTFVSIAPWGNYVDNKCLRRTPSLPPPVHFVGGSSYNPPDNNVFVVTCFHFARICLSRKFAQELIVRCARSVYMVTAIETKHPAIETIAYPLL
jgi:hypothetical protein